MAGEISPSTLVLDVNETLLDLTTLEPQFERLFGDPSVLRAWFAQLILYSEALTLSGLYTPFDEIAVRRGRSHRSSSLAALHGQIDPARGSERDASMLIFLHKQATTASH